MAELKATPAPAPEKFLSFAHDEHRSDDDERILNSPYVCGAALLASFGGFSFGYDQGVISLMLVMPQFIDQFPQIGENAPNYGFNKGFLTGMLELGAFLGCLLFPYLADKISRKWGITVATAFFTIGALIQTSAQNYDSLVAGRLIGGIGVGTLAMGAPLYISEIAPPNLRGSLMVLEAISIVIGAIFSGINAFVYYAPTFFAELGQDYNMSLILSGIVNICQLVGAIPILLYMDKIGRRKIAIYGALAMAIPHLIMAGVVGKFNSSWESHQAVARFGVALVYIYVLAYALSYGPLAWVLPAEVFPSSRRAKGVGIATATNWLANFVIGTVVPQMLVSIGWGTFLFFGVWCLIASVFSYFLVPETSNKSLEQVAAVFGDNLQADEEDLRRQVQREVWAVSSMQEQTP
ncbi:hypothetical protein PoHVEF18_010605 [Penicillium ochrochloron]